jgi:hypothetical protein
MAMFASQYVPNFLDVVAHLIHCWVEVLSKATVQIPRNLIEVVANPIQLIKYALRFNGRHQWSTYFMAKVDRLKHRWDRLFVEQCILPDCLVFTSCESDM